MALPEPLGREVAAPVRATRPRSEPEPSLPYRVVIGIDAPLGFPNAFVALTAGRRLTQQFGEGMGGNPYAFRETDRHVATRFKWPLSGAFDKLGNNATVAMHYVAAWKADGLSIVPFDNPRAQDDVALEVYPAIVRTRERGARPPWYRELAPGWATRSGDDADAVVCAALAVAWACRGRWGLPILAEPPGPLPQGEGGSTPERDWLEGRLVRASARVALLVLLLAHVAGAQAPSVFTGRVVGVLDGDSLVVLRDGREVQVRLHGVDAPEGGQAFGSVCKRALSNLVFGKTVTVQVVDIDRYKRSVSRVTADGLDVGLELIRGGFAWHYRQYSNDARYAAAQDDARRARRGLWQDARPTAPWEYRQARSSRPSPPAAFAGGRACGGGRGPVPRQRQQPRLSRAWLRELQLQELHGGVRHARGGGGGGLPRACGVRGAVGAVRHAPRDAGVTMSADDRRVSTLRRR